jgi:hypothetical protein
LTLFPRFSLGLGLLAIGRMLIELEMRINRLIGCMVKMPLPIALSEVLPDIIMPTHKDQEVNHDK